MTDLVIDSGVAIKWYVDEAYSPEARRLLAAYGSGALTLLAPDFIYVEINNIMWKKQTFQGFNPQDAQDIVQRFRVRQLFKLTAGTALLDDAYQLAVTYRRTVYDSLYLALSLRAGCQFVTADEKLVNAVCATFSNIIWLANWQ
jgi:predicted nucleic acid-binding protein